jgi:hypothetical protein
LLTRPDVLNIWDQPAAVTFVGADGKPHDHTFDFLVLLKDGTRVAVAVKPAGKAEPLVDTIERIAKQSAVTFAERITLITERDLPTWLVWNAEFIHSAMRERSVEDDAVVRDILADVVGSVKIGDVVRLSALGGRAVRAIARLLGTGELALLKPGRIRPQSLVTKAVASARIDGGR